MQRLTREFLKRALSTLIAITAVGTPAWSDTILTRSGEQYEGIIKKIEAGQVTVEINRQIVNFDIREIESMNFDTPHLLSTGTDEAMEHFLSDIDTQEVVENFAELDRTAAELQRLLRQIEGYWVAREPIEDTDVGAWETARERFRRPLSRYQEVLNDLYFHVLARVDEYNAITHEAGELYVGVKGIFKVGSPLLPDEMKDLPLRQYVPGSWYDTIFYEGYNLGYDEAYMRILGETAPNRQ